MNTIRTQYIENDFMKYQEGYLIFLPRFFTGGRILMSLKTLLQSGLVPVVSCAIILASIAGYVVAINYSMVRGASLKREQKAITLVETNVLQKETVLAGARTIASLKKQKEVALMENVGNVYYILQNASVAEASRNQVIR